MNQPRRFRRTAQAAVVTAVALALPRAAYAELLYATEGTSIARFSTSNLASVISTPVLGLQPGEKLLDIDVRATAASAAFSVYGLGSTGRLYYIDPFNGQTQQTGSAAPIRLNGTNFGIDFRPNGLHLRIVSDAEQNLQVSPDGSTVITDTSINYFGNVHLAASVVSVAYDNRDVGSTTEYAIDSASGGLVSITETEQFNGRFNPIGSLGLGTNLNPNIGFEIARIDTTPYASITVGGVSRLYRLSLTTGLATPLGTIGNGATSYRGLAAASIGDFYADPADSDTDPPLTPVPAPTSSSEWKAFRTNSGNWTDLTRWTGTRPSGVGAVADFLGHSSLTGDTTVTIGTSQTTGVINFYEGASALVSFTIAGSSGTLHLDNGSMPARIANYGGDHQITTQVALDGDTNVSVFRKADRLQLTNLLPTSFNIQKLGDGTLAVNRLQSQSLQILNGKVSITSNASTNRVSSLTIARYAYYPAQLDLKGSKLIVDGKSIGFLDAARTYRELIGYVQKGRNGGTWDGPGIITSMPDALAFKTTIGIASAGEAMSIPVGGTALWGGQTVSADDALIMYTYAGDLNLDGVVNADDYAYIDLYSTQFGASGYTHGDINYDGTINADDYALIDSNSINGGPPFQSRPSSGAEPSLAAVPEPAIGSLAMAASLLLARRRRQ